MKRNAPPEFAMHQSHDSSITRRLRPASAATTALATSALLMGVLVAGGALLPPPAHATAVAEAGTAREPANDAERMIQATADELIGIVHDAALEPAAKRAKIEDSLYGKADFTLISKLVLARSYSKFDDAQRTEFEKEFRSYLSSTYGKNIDTYTEGQASVDDTSMQLLGSHDETRGDMTVQTKIVRKGEPNVLVNYRLRRIDDAWKIIDVIAEGISMISNLRSQFQEIISSSGPEGLLRKLREKNATS